MAPKRSAIIDDFMLKIQVGYNLPHHMDLVGKRARLDGIIGILNGEEEVVLEEFAAIWIETYTKTVLPTWADVVGVLKVAREKIAETRAKARYEKRMAERAQTLQQEVTFPYQADQVMRTKLGFDACREGWQCELHDFVTRHGRAPNSEQQASLKIQAQNTERKYYGRRLDEFEKLVYSARTGRMESLKLAAVRIDQ